MAYIKYKEISKYFNFSKLADSNKLPKYVCDYIYEDELILNVYKTTRDYGMFTDKKIVLFDNTKLFGTQKAVYTIFYASISSCSIIYKIRGAEIYLLLDSGYPLRLKFTNMNSIDKVRLRLLYSCISRAINKQVISNELIKELKKDKLEFN